MEKIPTVEELINKIDNEFYEKNSYYLSISNPNLFAKTLAIEVTKLHVVAALKEASATDIVSGKSYKHRAENDKDSILNSYPLDKIK